MICLLWIIPDVVWAIATAFILYDLFHVHSINKKLEREIKDLQFEFDEFEKGYGDKNERN